MRKQTFMALVPALLLWTTPVLTHAAVGISVAVNIAPPALPVYVQPALPAPGYIWTPGYWAWGGADYYWVPGTWVMPPVSGMLWTPGYWAWREGVYGWNEGYWGPQVGFYGGVNYGFGYNGVGFHGGYWHGGAFFYNRSVANFGHVNIVNVYNAPVEMHERSRVSFNGGQGGLHWQPTGAERSAMSEQHREPTGPQREHVQHAAGMPAMHMQQNGGRPQILTTQRAGDFAHPGPGLHNHAQPQVHGGARPNAEQFNHGGAPGGMGRHEGGAGPQVHGGPGEHMNNGAQMHGQPGEGRGQGRPQGQHEQGQRQQGQHEQGQHEPGGQGGHEQGGHHEH